MTWRSELSATFFTFVFIVGTGISRLIGGIDGVASPGVAGRGRFVRLGAILVGGLMLSGEFSSSALATPILFTYTTTVTSGGTPGVSDGDLLTFEVIADNGNASLMSQSWFQIDVISAVASVGTYVANFIFPHFVSDPVFVTDGIGTLISTNFFDLDDNNFDNLGDFGSPFPILFSDGILTSVGSIMFFQGTPSQFPSAWNVRVVQVPEPTTLVLFGFGLAGLGFFMTRRRKLT